MKELLHPSVEKYFGVIRGLHNAASSNPEINHPIIDIDVAPEHIDPIEHSDLTEYHNEIDKLFFEFPKDRADSNLVFSNLSSTSRVLDVLIGEYPVNGGQASYADYIQSTMGIEPKEIPGELLFTQESKLRKITEEMGYDYEPSSREDFLRDQSIPTDDMEETINDMYGIAMNDIGRLFGSGVLSRLEEPEINIDSYDGTWQGYFGTEDDKFVLQFNSNPLIQASEEDVKATANHELAHWVSAAIKKQAIESSKLSPTAGLMLFASIPYAQEEVIARAAELIPLYRQSDIYSTYARENIAHKANVTHNMLMMISIDEYSEEEVTDYGIAHLPLEKPEKISKMTWDFMGKLIYKTVVAVDSDAVWSGRQIAQQPSSDKERGKILLDLCQDPYI